MTAFSVPHAETPEEAERVYASFAEWCRVPVPPPGKRIHSITYVHDGEEWTATVGEQLRGRRTRTMRRKAGPTEVTTRLSDSATVLAIFPGSPYLVVTDARPITSRPSGWENPFMAGRPRGISYFDAETGAATTDGGVSDSD